MMTLPLLKSLKPSLVFVQSPRTSNIYERYGFRAEFLPSGVNTQRFLPISTARKTALRKSWGIDPNSFVVLHVGPARPGRNLGVLMELAKKGCYVIVVASSSISPDLSLITDLRGSGCKVLTSYVSNIEEIYAISDCYVFPTVNPFFSIEFPLSVLEAMSCNISIVAYPFGGLPTCFKDGDGYAYANSHESLIEKVMEQRSSRKSKLANREKVLRYDWIHIAKQVENMYFSQS